eukprot:jgi/Mesvir1/20457/Mv25334-RA.1
MVVITIPIRNSSINTTSIISISRIIDLSSINITSGVSIRPTGSALVSPPLVIPLPLMVLPLIRIIVAVVCINGSTAPDPTHGGATARTAPTHADP